MKNKILGFLFLVLTLAMTTSCEDIFDYEDETKLSLDDIFNDYYSTERFVNTCYAVKTYFYGNYGGASSFLAAFTDEAQSVNRSNIYNDYYNGAMSSSNQIILEDHIDDLYEGINYCNIFLENIEDVDESEFEKTTYKSRWKGEIYTLRAFYAWQIVKRYGPMPISREVLSADYDYSTLVKPTHYEAVQAIIADCQAALAEPSFLWRQEITASNEMNSVTRAVAYAIQSQAILFTASPMWNDESSEDYSKIWAEAAEITKESLEEVLANGHELYTAVADGDGLAAGITAYQDLFLRGYGDYNNVTNKETFMYRTINNLYTNYGIPIGGSVSGSTISGCGISPTQELVDAYDTAQGNPLLDLEKPYLDAAHLQPNYSAAALAETGENAFDSSAPYENRDPRLRASIFCNGDYFYLTDNTYPVEIYSGGNCQLDQSDTRYTDSGYYMRKFVRWTSSSTDNTDGAWSYFRLAELYLNYAEALLESGGAVSDVLANINPVRTRGDQLPALTTTDRDELRRRLRNERRVEFTFEEHRYFDLRRWKENQNYEGLVTGINITKEDSGDFTYDRFSLSTRNVTATKYRLWPISQTEELKYISLGLDMQNPGW